MLPSLFNATKAVFTALPSALTAAKARCVDWMRSTFTSGAYTPDESPPYTAMPQVTTVPSLFRAAKEYRLEKTFTTSDVREDAAAPGAPPYAALPHATTLPSFLRAEKAYQVEKTAVTPLVSDAATAADEPPYAASPQETTLPSYFIAANEANEEYTLITPDFSELATALESPPYVGAPHVITLPLLFNAAMEPSFLFAARKLYEATSARSNRNTASE
jgi:hypothetical protein